MALGCWRWRFLMDAPALQALAPCPSPRSPREGIRFAATRARRTNLVVAGLAAQRALWKRDDVRFNWTPPA